MLEQILAKLTPAEREWLLGQIEQEPKRGRGQPKKLSLDQQAKAFWDVCAALDASKWKNAKKAIGDAADKLGVSRRTLDRALNAELERRKAMQPSIDRLRERLARAGMSRRRQ